MKDLVWLDERDALVRHALLKNKQWLFVTLHARAVFDVTARRIIERVKVAVRRSHVCLIGSKLRPVDCYHAVGYGFNDDCTLVALGER